MYFLLLKTCTCKLKYLCKHTGTHESAQRYLGSGVYWRRHLKAHNCEICTQVLHETTNLKTLTRAAKYYSKIWDVAASKEWANLIPESGRDGSMKGWKHTEKTKRKMSRSQSQRAANGLLPMQLSPLTGKKNGMFKGYFKFHHPEHGTHFVHATRLANNILPELKLHRGRLYQLAIGKYKTKRGDYRGWTVL